MGTYHLGAQLPRWVCRRAQDGQLGAGYVHRIPPPPSPSISARAQQQTSRTSLMCGHKW